MPTGADSPSETPVTRALDDLGIPYRFFRHPGPVFSLEQAAVERGQSPDQVIRSIVFRLNEGEYFMVLAAGPHQISWPILRKLLGVSRLTMASQVEVFAVTGYETGAVSPFGLPAPLPLLVDRRVFDSPEVSLGSGIRSTTVILSRDALRMALTRVYGEYQVADLVTA
jgi:Cys-tRNA(Pro)/Cys-tRNA(Cys) deacylase